MKTDPKVSKYFSEMNAKRKNKAGGFSNPEVQKKALETRLRNSENEKKLYQDKKPSQATE